MEKGPFEELCRMFLNIKSEICKYDQACSTNLCSYNHSKSDSRETQTDKHQRKYKFECENCDFKFNSYNLFLDHINSNHLESDFDPDFYVMSDDPNGPPLYVHCRCSPISIM